MAVVTKLANTNQAVSETVAWVNPNNAHSSTDANASATNTPAKNQSNTRSWGFPAFTTSDIPDGSTINSVILRHRYGTNNTTSTGSVLGIRGSINTTLFGTETTYAMSTSFITTTYEITSGVTLTDLRTANVVRANMRGNRANSNNAVIWSVEYIELEVDYTAAIPPIPNKIRQFNQSIKRGSNY